MKPKSSINSDLLRKSGSIWQIEKDLKDDNHPIIAEIIIDDWLHLEQMCSHEYYLRIGQREFEIQIPKRKKQSVIIIERKTSNEINK